MFGWPLMTSRVVLSARSHSPKPNSARTSQSFVTGALLC